MKHFYEELNIEVKTKLIVCKLHVIRLKKVKLRHKKYYLMREKKKTFIINLNDYFKTFLLRVQRKSVNEIDSDLSYEKCFSKIKL